MQQRLLYLWFPTLATDHYLNPGHNPVEIKDAKDFANTPFACTREDHNGAFLCGINKLASDAGLQNTMRLADARAMISELVTRPARAQADHDLLHKMAINGNHYAPWIAIDPPNPVSGEGGLWLNITGVPHLFDGEEAMIKQVAQSYRVYGCKLQLGLSDTPLGAKAAARFHTGNGILNTQHTKREIHDFPLEALCLKEETIRTLNRLGLRHVGDLYPIPRANLTTRFGTEVVHALDRILGIFPDQLPYLHGPHIHEIRRQFVEPLGSAEIIEQVITHMLKRLCQRLSRENLGVRKVGFRFKKLGRQISTLMIATSSPTYDINHLLRLLDDRLPGVDAGFGIEEIHVRVFQTQRIERKQVGLIEAENCDRPTPQLNNLVDRLRSRLGSKNVWYPDRRASYIPERSTGRNLKRPSGSTAPYPALPDRPVRLMRPPEPVRILNINERGMPNLLNWRRQHIKVENLQGPERITREWWRNLKDDPWQPDKESRDYYRCNDQAGRSLWLCHVHTSSKNCKWYIHGWFG